MTKRGDFEFDRVVVVVVVVVARIELCAIQFVKFGCLLIKNCPILLMFLLNRVVTPPI